jgi:hypothetical protein
MQILLGAARDAGLLGRDVHYDLEGIMDASSAEFTLNAEGGVHTVSAYALMESTDTPMGPDAAVAEARARLATLQAQLGNLDGLLGAEIGHGVRTGHVGPALVSPVRRRRPRLPPTPVAWPFDALATFTRHCPSCRSAMWRGLRRTPTT